MKPSTCLLLLVLTIILLGTACQKEPPFCSKTEDLGQLKLSEQSLEWLPPSFYDATDSSDMVFTNGLVDSMVFSFKHLIMVENNFDSIVVSCPSGEGTQTVHFATQSYYKTYYCEERNFELRISLRHALENSSVEDNNESDFYEYLDVSLLGHDYSNYIGSLNIITNLRNAEQDEIRWRNADRHEIINDFSFTSYGETFPLVYSNVIDITTDSHGYQHACCDLGRIYVVKSRGLIGFRFGSLWMLRE